MKFGIEYEYGQNVSLSHLCGSIEGLTLVFLRLFYLVHDSQGNTLSIWWFNQGLSCNDSPNECIPYRCIETCHERGIKVLLTIEKRTGQSNRNSTFIIPSNLITILSDGPFDGFNMVARDSRWGYLEVLRMINGFADRRRKIISVTVQCTFPDGYAGPIHRETMLEDAPAMIDMIVVQMYGSGGACHYAHRDAFWQSIGSWQSWMRQGMDMAIGLLSRPQLPGDFVPVEEFEGLLEAMQVKSLDLIVFSPGEPVYFKDKHPSSKPPQKPSSSLKSARIATNQATLLIIIAVCLLLIYAVKTQLL